MATRILAHRGLLAEGARVAALVGTEVVYLAARGVSAATMTPYDVAALRLADGLDLAGAPPEDVERYLAVLRGDPTAGAVAILIDGVSKGADVRSLIERLTGSPWEEAEAQARAAGALMGAYPGDR